VIVPTIYSIQAEALIKMNNPKLDNDQIRIVSAQSYGSVRDSALDLAEHEDVDLIVCGSRGSSAPKRAVLGKLWVETAQARCRAFHIQLARRIGVDIHLAPRAMPRGDRQMIPVCTNYPVE
jgi:hypothetical protein